MRKKLSSMLLDTVKLWNRDRKRSSFLFCPICHHDLNGDDNSFVKEADMYWFFKCANCGCKSKFLLAYMVPIATEWQVFAKPYVLNPKGEA